ncbi:MAG: hypothetical protein HOO96_13195 [Polyangiaceae bacterium]|nr:hypothetical protein [Polyangiaceae bacterium]
MHRAFRGFLAGLFGLLAVNACSGSTTSLSSTPDSSVADAGIGVDAEGDDAATGDASLRGDGGDGGASVDSGALCVAQSGGGGSGGSGSCSSESTYACGTETRGIACKCPEARCTCTLNGVAVKEISFGKCPACGFGTADLAACGITVAPDDGGGGSSTSSTGGSK